MERLLFFPTALPDELLYSLAVRYHRMAANRSYRHTSQELFGTYSRTCGSVLPCCLGALSSRLTEQYSIEHIINTHTLLPLYEPFIGEAVLQNARRRMEGRQGSGLKMSLGMTASRFLRFPGFRLCQDCIKEDRLVFGIDYWHRIHQAAGVCVCPHHESVLLSARFPYDADWRCMVLPGEVQGTPVIGDVALQAAHAVAMMQLWGLEHPSSVEPFIKVEFLKQQLDGLGLLRSGRLREAALRDYLGTRVQVSPQDGEFHELTRCCDWVLRILRPRHITVQPFRFYFLCWLLNIDIRNSEAPSSRLTSASPSVARCRKGRKGVQDIGKINAARQAFIEDENPKCRDKCGYHWLYHNDRGWLKNYVDLHPFMRHARERVNWRSRDLELHGKIFVAKFQILNLVGMPKKITRSSLVRLINNHYDFLRIPEKFPVSTKALINAIETEHTFQVRKVVWAAKTYVLDEGSKVSEALRLAGIRVSHLSDGEVQDILRSVRQK